MLKFFKTNALLGTALLAVFSVNAQTTIVDESFDKWGAGGYTTWTNCETYSVTKTSKDTTVSYNSVPVTFTLTDAVINPGCSFKPGTNVSCQAANPEYSDLGYISLDKTNGALTTSLFSSVDKVSLTLGWTGSYRNALLQSSPDGITWTTVPASVTNDTLRGDKCGQYGVVFQDIPVNKTNVKLRVIPTLDYKTQPNVLQNVRIHKLVVTGTNSLTSINETSWSESGATISSSDNSISLTSTVNGTVSIVNITGALIAQINIQQGGDASFVMPSTGVYVVRFVSDNKIYTKKIMVK